MLEFRWILLGLGTLLIAAIWWWGARGSRQAAGNAQLREAAQPPPPGGIGTPGPVAPTPEAHPSAPQAPAMVAPPPLSQDPGSGRLPTSRGRAEHRDWGVPPLAPVNIRTADFDQIPVLDEPFLIEPGDGRTPTATRVTPSATMSAPTTVSAPTTRAPVPDAVAVAAPAAVATPPPAATNGGEEPNARQRIVALRVCAVHDGRWTGAQLLDALERQGLAHGKYQVFHRRHVDGRSVFCVASLIEPGSFDLASMPAEEFRGVTLFAVLPGPLPPLPAWEALHATALRLAADLSGMVQDSKGIPLSPQRAAALREDVVRFQELLS